MGEASTRAFILVPAVILLLMASFYMLGFFLATVLGVPRKLGLPLQVRLLGLVTVLFSLALLRWFFSYRRPVDVLVSTYETFAKMVGRIRLQERTRRTEQLTVRGPYKYVRHPLYSCILLLALGLWLLFDNSSLAVFALLLLVWFNLVVTPFEEKELRAIFADEYVRYARNVPKMIPSLRHHKEYM
jgi:hypothetical protein